MMVSNERLYEISTLLSLEYYILSAILVFSSLSGKYYMFSPKHCLLTTRIMQNYFTEISAKYLNETCVAHNAT